MMEDRKQELVDRLPLLSPFDGDYYPIPFPNRVEKVTRKAALIHFQRRNGVWVKAWIPQSIMRIDTLGNLFVQEWYFVKNLK